MLVDQGPCKYCRHVLGGISIRHKITECQYRQSMYCCVCQAYGHADDDCPNKKAWTIRAGKDASTIINHELHIIDTEEDIKEVIRRHGLKPGTRKDENRKILRNLANSLNPPRLVLFSKPI